MPGILAQGRIGLIKGLAVCQRADDGQVVGAGATERRAALELLRVQLVGVQTADQVTGDFLEHLQIAQMLGGARRQVVTVEVKAGAQGVFAQSRRGDVTFGTHHRGQALAFSRLRQTGDLPANALERQVGTLGKALDLCGTGQDHHRCTGQQ
ncbi:hypothetical protein D3C81_1658640 [compost metagenome]